MNDPKINKKFAVAKGPVNRRLVAADTAGSDKASPLALARLQAAQARQRLGRSLAQRLSGQRQPTGKQALSPADIMVAMGAAASVVGLVLGVIQSSVPIAAVSAVLVCGFGWRSYVALQKRRELGVAVSSSPVDFVDHNDIALLDTAMEKLALEASQDTVDKLSELKTLIVQCVALISQTKSTQALANDDQLFIRECIRRYAPDSISSYLRVPSKDRASLVIEEGKTATQLLHGQIDMLMAQLRSKEQRLTQLSGESLMQQQRFLAVKTGKGLD